MCRFFGRFASDRLLARVARIFLANAVLVQVESIGMLGLQIEAFDFGLQRLPERIAAVVKQLDAAPFSGAGA